MPQLIPLVTIQKLTSQFLLCYFDGVCKIKNYFEKIKSHIFISFKARILFFWVFGHSNGLILFYDLHNRCPLRIFGIQIILLHVKLWLCLAKLSLFASLLQYLYTLIQSFSVIRCKSVNVSKFSPPHCQYVVSSTGLKLLPSSA